VDLLVLLIGQTLRALLPRRLRIPQIDMKTLDLLDQHENRFTGRAEIVAAVRHQTRAPGSKLVDLALVQALVQMSPEIKDPVYDVGEKTLSNLPA
jgi:hypothetical protein